MSLVNNELLRLSTSNYIQSKPLDQFNPSTQDLLVLNDYVKDPDLEPNELALINKQVSHLVNTYGQKTFFQVIFEIFKEIFCLTTDTTLEEKEYREALITLQVSIINKIDSPKKCEKKLKLEIHLKDHDFKNQMYEYLDISDEMRYYALTSEWEAKKKYFDFVFDGDINHLEITIMTIGFDDYLKQLIEKSSEEKVLKDLLVLYLLESKAQKFAETEFSTIPEDNLCYIVDFDEEDDEREDVVRNRVNFNNLFYYATKDISDAYWKTVFQDWLT